MTDRSTRAKGNSSRMSKRHVNVTLMASLAALLSSVGCGGDGAAGAGSSIVFTASGEALALSGYAFPPAPGAEVAFVDGWEVRFTELLVTVNAVTLAADPDLDPGDASQTGAVVAEVRGPWVIDLHRSGSLPGKGGSDDRAVEIARVDRQNKKGDAPFEADRRYAFGFDVGPASASAKLVNLDEQGKADYELMKKEGYTVLYVGTATFKGMACSPADPVFDALPKVVDFKLGFKSPTTYQNCQNPDNDPAAPLASEEHQRGVVIKANQPTIAQLTFHTDHAFWDSFVHDAPLHFDPIAARYAGMSGTPLATLEDLRSLNPKAFTTGDGRPLPWRTCRADFAPPEAGQMHFNSGGIPVDPKGDPERAIRDYAEFMTYNQSTQGHLNADGLCFVKRGYPSPP